MATKEPKITEAESAEPPKSETCEDVESIEGVTYEGGHIALQRTGVHKKNRRWIVLRGLLTTLFVDMLILIAIGGIIQVRGVLKELTSQIKKAEIRTI